VAPPSARAAPPITTPPDWPPPAPRPSGQIVPLAPDRYKLQCTIDGSTLEKLRLAKDMLRHAIPSGDDAAILDRAFTALLADLARNKFAATERAAEKAGPSRATAPGSRHIPADVKRAVWVRDIGRCAFVARDGRRCNERAFVEFHHVRPYATGGEASVENIQLRCRRHNDYEARTYFALERDHVPEPARHAAQSRRALDVRAEDPPPRAGVHNTRAERTNSFQNEFERADSPLRSAGLTRSAALPSPPIAPLPVVQLPVARAPSSGRAPESARAPSSR
jgi:hypothetical protein